MTDRPVEGDHPDFSPIPGNVENDKSEQRDKTQKDDPGVAPESGDKQPEWTKAAYGRFFMVITIRLLDRAFCNNMYEKRPHDLSKSEADESH